MSARIVHFTNKHAATSVRIFGKECRSLAAAGYEVHILAPDPPAAARDGVRFHAIPAYRAVRRAPLQSWRELRGVLRTALELDADLYQFHDPELIPTALKLAALGKRVVYDVHEDFPREALALHQDRPWYGRLKSWAWVALEARAKRRLAGFACATPEIARHFPPDRTILVRNFPVLDEFADAPATAYAQRPANVAYVGILTAIRGVREALDAMAQLDVPQARLVVGGRFEPPAYEAALTSHPGWRAVDFRGWLDRAGVAELLGDCRVGLVTLHPTETHRTSYPVKLFEYMAAGLPVVASDFPLWREIVESAGCGRLCDPLDPADIAAQLRWLLEHPDEAAAMGAAGRAAVQERYHWGAEATTLVAFYERLLS